MTQYDKNEKRDSIYCQRFIASDANPNGYERPHLFFPLNDYSMVTFFEIVARPCVLNSKLNPKIHRNRVKLYYNRHKPHISVRKDRMLEKKNVAEILTIIIIATIFNVG